MGLTSIYVPEIAASWPWTSHTTSLRRIGLDRGVDRADTVIRRHGEALSPLNCGRVGRGAVADLGEVVMFIPGREPGIARDSRITVAMSGSEFG